MTELQGTEKQIAWAKDIKKFYQGELSIAISEANSNQEQMRKEVAIEGLVVRLLGRSDGIKIGKETGFTLSFSEVQSLDPEERKTYRHQKAAAIRKAREARAQQAIELAKKAIETEKSAKWWIDHRF